MAQKTHKITLEPLDSKKAHKVHEEIVRDVKSYSLTFNISKILMDRSMKEQYTQGRNAILRLFKNLSSLFLKGMVSGEFNKNKNMHFHCYFTSNCETAEQLRDAIKTYIVHEWHNLWTLEGKGWRLKKVDEISDELDNYPFKDIARTNVLLKFSCVQFQMSHTIFERKIPTFKPRKNYETATTRAIDEFLKFWDQTRKTSKEGDSQDNSESPEYINEIKK